MRSALGWACALLAAVACAEGDEAREAAGAGVQSEAVPEGAPAPSETGARPNVLFIVVDDLRPELGCYDVPAARTPHIDRLASGGIVFRSAYCQESLCSPSRVSVLTGLYPWSSGFSRNRQSFREVLPDVVTLPQHFRAQGWRSICVGKVFHEGTEDAVSWSEPAWDAPLDSGYALAENQRTAKSRGQRAPIERADAPADQYRDGRVATRAIEVLRAHDPATPLFLAVGFVRPHLPFAAPAPYFEAVPKFDWSVRATPPTGSPAEAGTVVWPLSNYGISPQQAPDRRAELVHAYYAATAFVDAQIGRVLDELEAQELDEDTIVVVWGDHGYYLGEYGLWGKTGCFDVSLRSPLVMRVPGKNAGPSDALVEFVDLFPTLCELAGIEPPGPIDGESFAGLFESLEAPTREVARSWHSSRRTVGWSVKTERYRLTSWRDPKNPEREVAVELYDHGRDAAETVNVASDPAHAEALAGLRRHLDAFEGGGR